MPVNRFASKLGTAVFALAFGLVLTWWGTSRELFSDPATRKFNIAVLVLAWSVTVALYRLVRRDKPGGPGGTSMRPLLSTTGQAERLTHASACFLLALFASPSVRFFGHPWADLGAVWNIIGVLVECVVIAVVVTLFGVAVVSACRIRCPRCGLRWLLYAIRRESVGEWLPWLKTFSVCPKCGFSCPDDSRGAHAA
jgi:hypothetical protein